MNIPSIDEKSNISAENRLSLIDTVFSLSNTLISGNHKLIYLRTAEFFTVGMRTQVDYNALEEKTGLSRQTISAAYQYLQDKLDLLTVEVQFSDRNDKKSTRTYITLKPLFFDIGSWRKNNRGHGGAYYTCEECGSTHLRTIKKIKVVKQITCLDCGAVKEVDCGEITTKDRGAARKLKTLERPLSNLDSAFSDEKAQKPLSNLTSYTNQLPPPAEKANETAWCAVSLPTTAADDYSALFEDESDEEPEPPAPKPRVRKQVKTGKNLEAAALEYMCHAITHADAIKMGGTPGKKYTDMKRPATPADNAAHFAGRTTIGTTIADDVSNTWMFVVDGDDAAEFAIIAETARKAYRAGYRMLLEHSPATGSHKDGGHGYIFFCDAVDARSVRQHLIRLSPEFAKLKEIWPGKKTRVRLPGGRYRYENVDEWCVLTDAQGEQLSHGGVSGAVAAYQNLTDAAIVPAYIEEQKATTRKSGIARKKIGLSVDTYHQKKYGTSNNFRHEFSEKQLIAFVNETLSCENALRSGNNGHHFADWRGEHTASVAVYDDNTWCDFGGLSPHHNDGRFDGGDAVELYCRINDLPRKEALRLLGKEFARKLHAASQEAARSGQPIPDWVQRYSRITELGWQLYKRIAALAGFANWEMASSMAA